MTEKRSFRDWFDNVFWYHYKWYFLAAVFVLAVVIFIITDSPGKENYDMTVVFVQSGDVAESQAAAVLDGIADAVGDVNGDGEVKLNYAYVNMGESSADKGASGYSPTDQLLVYLTGDEYALFIMDAEISNECCQANYFEDVLADYGIDTPEDDPYRVYLSDTGLMKKAGLDNRDYYGLIMDWTTVGKGSKDNTDAAVNALKAILAS